MPRLSVILTGYPQGGVRDLRAQHPLIHDLKPDGWPHFLSNLKAGPQLQHR